MKTGGYADKLGMPAKLRRRRDRFLDFISAGFDNFLSRIFRGRHMMTESGRISGTGYLARSEVVVRNVTYCLGVYDDGRGEGTVFADLTLLRDDGEAEATLHLNSGLALKVLLFDMDLVGGRATIRTLGRIDGL